MLNSIAHNKKLGAVLTVVIASLLIFVFFNRHILEANQVSFASGGDGLKSTFGTLYHIQYDSSYWHFQGMNYPYGESVFFTGNQTFLTNIIKFCKELGIDYSDKTVGILNIWLLFSFVICSLFLFLIFYELGLPVWYSILGSLIITFLTPQWDRLGGHYNLGYAYVFPIAIYLMMRFYRKPAYGLSILFGLFIFIIAGKHVYYIALVGILWVVYCVWLIVNSKTIYARNWINLLPHFIIQLILPSLIFIIFSSSHDMASDRTAYPWGFFPSTTRWESVFLPLGLPYGRFIHIKGGAKTVGYVGLVSALILILTIVLFIRRWIKHGYGNALKISDQTFLNVLFLGGLIALLISLGYPFYLGMEKLLNYAGPLRQFRAIGRFVFPFFYVMNIYSLYILWKWLIGNQKRWITLIIFIALLWSCYDAWLNIRNKPDNYYNRFEVLNDTENLLPENQWIHKHDWSEYQAIMPLPYYHIGSENYWVNGNSPIILDSYFASLKTGLPLNSVMLSRTSIDQTLANLDLFYEPYDGYSVLERYHPEKPVLLMYRENSRLSPPEQNLVNHSIPLESGGEMKYYKLYPDSLQAIQNQNALKTQGIADSITNAAAMDWYCLESYASNPDGRYSGKMKKEIDFFSCVVPDSGTYTVSFWYNGAGRDLWPRTNLFISRFDSADHRYSYMQTDFFRETVLREGDWALVEYTVDLQNPGDRIMLSYLNKVVAGGTMEIDRVLLKPASGIIVEKDEGNLWINNRSVHVPN